MKIDLPGLEAFVTVAQFGNFTRAGQHLNLSQTAVTHRISKLERNLGVKLLQRSTRDVMLTRAGSDLLPRLKTILDDLTGELLRVRVEAARTDVPLLTIACLPTIAMQILPSALAVFHERNPAVVVRTLDTSSAEIAPLITQGVAEFGLTIMGAGNEELITEPLFTEDYLLVCPAGHALAKRREVSWSDISREKLIRVSPHTANRFIVDQALGDKSESMNWAFEVQHTLTAVRLVQEGLGLTVIPRSAAEGLRAEGVHAIPLTKPRITRTIGILSRRQVGLSMLAQDFRSALHTCLRPNTAPAEAPSDVPKSMQ
jgi:DNA-binding transcriptional LysR family regulator